MFASANRFRSLMQRLSLLLVVCALLAKAPFGMMPAANAQGVSFGWCNAVSPDIADEGRALLAAALADRDAEPQVQGTGDTACAFAVATPLAPSPETAGLPAPIAQTEALTSPADYIAPGLGLAAPPPFATGPPARV